MKNRSEISAYRLRLPKQGGHGLKFKFSQYLKSDQKKFGVGCKAVRNYLIRTEMQFPSSEKEGRYPAKHSVFQKRIIKFKFNCPGTKLSS